MGARARLCAHLADAAPGPAPFEIAPEDALAWQDGPLDAIARCRRCGQGALLQLVDWSPARGVRVHAVSGVRAEDLAVYARNRRSASCDLARAQAELDALVAAAGPCELLYACDAEASRLLAVAPFPREASAPRGEWAARLPAADDERWFAPLALGK
jgi:hypothetical protein